jgi:hypothetical protein
MEHTKKTMLEALEKSLGVVTTACKQANVGRTTHYRWMEEDKEYREAVTALKLVALDFAESKLHSSIAEGNVTAIIFYLKTKGKKRGYIERQEIEVQEKKPLSWLDES